MTSTSGFIFMILEIVFHRNNSKTFENLDYQKNNINLIIIWNLRTNFSCFTQRGSVA